MEVINNVEQGSIEWKRLRHGKVGGSSAASLLVKELYNSAIFHEICAEMCEEFDEYEIGYVSPDMERGNNLEPLARIELEKLTKLTFTVPAWIQSDIEILGISPDGITEDLTIGCEIKCPAKKEYNAYLVDKNYLVDKYAPQIANYFAANSKLEKVYMCAYRPEHRYRQLITVEVTKEFIFNNGTEKTPKMYTIGQLVDDIRTAARKLEEMCKVQIEKYKF